MPRHRQTEFCTAAIRSCYIYALEDLVNRLSLKKDECDCLPSCTSLSYDLDAVYSPADWMTGGEYDKPDM